jgi:putative tryptophan/tyrosine transport system substrate-binding protein
MRVGRRRFVAGAGAVGLGLVAGCERLPGRAPPAKPPTIGILLLPATMLMAPTFQEGLHDLGYVEGQNLNIEQRRVLERDFSDLDARAAELVDLQVAVLVAFTTPAALAAKRATSSIPIVFTLVSDPVGSGLVASIARPGGNATGLSDFGSSLSGKRLELLRDAVPGTTRIGVVWSSRNPVNALLWRESEAAAPTLGIQLISLELRTEDRLEDVFETAARERAEAIVVLGGPDIVEPATVLAAAARLPTMVEQPIAARTSGLMSYGPNRSALSRRTAYYVDRILKGAKSGFE